MTAMLEGAFALALIEVMPRILGPKGCRKRGCGAMIRNVRESIPVNGDGPVVAARRNLVMVLEGNCRVCPFRRDCKIKIDG